MAKARPYQIPAPEDFDAARQAAGAYLAKFPPPRHSAILCGAMVNVYAGETPVSDAAVWIQQRGKYGYQPGIAQKSLNALREIGILDEVDETDSDVIVYPRADSFKRDT